MTTAVQLAQSVAPGVSLGFKNRIINGGMTIDQRNAGASVTIPSGATFVLDRWGQYASQASKYSAQKVTGGYGGFSAACLITSASAYSVASGDYFYMSQRIEGYNVADLNWGSASASAVTLSFKVYSSLAGTFGGALRNSGASRSYPFSYSIPVANTWTTISITVPGDTTGTWLTDNGVGLEVAFSFGMGSTYSGTAGVWASTNYASATGATSVVGTNGATFYITGVQLEVGTAATSFEFRDYTREMQLCQRYYCLVDCATGYYTTPYAYGFGPVTYPVLMRTTPSITNTSFNGAGTGSYYNGPYFQNERGFSMQVWNSSNTHIWGYGNFNCSAEL